MFEERMAGQEFCGVVAYFLHTDGSVRSICLETCCTNWCELGTFFESDVSALCDTHRDALQQKHHSQTESSAGCCSEVYRGGVLKSTFLTLREIVCKAQTHLFLFKTL